MRIRDGCKRMEVQTASLLMFLEGLLPLEYGEVLFWIRVFSDSLIRAYEQS